MSRPFNLRFKLQLFTGMLVMLMKLGCDSKEAIPDVAQGTETDVSPLKSVASSLEAQPNPTPKKGNDLSPQEVAEACQTICEKTASLPCVKLPSCVEGCKESFSMPVCRSEFGAMLTCTVAADAGQFVCDSPEAPALKDGQCEKEQDRASLCLGRMTKAGASPPASSQR